MKDVKKEKSLKQVFIRCILTLVLTISISIIIPLIIFEVFINKKIILPANYYELKAKSMEKRLKNFTLIKDRDIPKELSYVIFDKKMNITSTNLNNKEIKETIEYIRGNREGRVNCYIYIQTPNNSCVLQYPIKPKYKNRTLNRLLPNPMTLIFIITILNILISCIVTIIIFSKKLKEELLPLLNTTRQINIQNLDFVVEKSKIKEFNEILDSIIDMREELKDTLKKKWEEDKMKNQQLSALSHDIKTPLTIIKGNTQLLLESDSIEEGKEYGNFILDGAIEIEQYINILSTSLKAECNLSVQKNKIYTRDFINKIEKSAYSLFQTKKIILKVNYKDIPEIIEGDETYIYRAVTNILSNAFDYSKVNGNVYLHIYSKDNYLYFKIIDEGIGFTSEGIKCASKIFYQEDKSRSKNSHYGIGLYLADLVAKEHGGDLILGNSDKTVGAEVTFKMKIK